MKLFDKFKYSLAKTRAVIVSKFVSPLWNPEEMERALLAADFGPKLANEIIAGVRKRLELNPRPTTEEAIEAAKAEVESMLQGSHSDSPLPLLKLTAYGSAMPKVIILGAGTFTTTDFPFPFDP